MSQVQFRKRKKKIRFAKSNRVRYFDSSTSTISTNNIQNEREEEMNASVITDAMNHNTNPSNPFKHFERSNHNQYHSTFNQKVNDLDDALQNAEQKAKKHIAKTCTDDDDDDTDDNEDELKYDPDPLYDARQDRTDEKYVYRKYVGQSAIQSDCTVCCANCFMFISYVSQKHRTVQNKYKCFAVNNCTVSDDDSVICKQCKTQIGTRERVSYLSSNGSNNEAKQETKHESTQDMNEIDTTSNEEEDVWKLISSDFSTLKAPILNVSETDDPKEDTFDSEANGCDHNNDDNNDSDIYIYHLTNVLPGML